MNIHITHALPEFTACDTTISSTPHHKHHQIPWPVLFENITCVKSLLTLKYYLVNSCGSIELIHLIISCHSFRLYQRYFFIILSNEFVSEVVFVLLMAFCLFLLWKG